MFFMGELYSSVVGLGNTGNAGDAQSHMAWSLGDISVSLFFYFTCKRVIHSNDQYLGRI